MPQQRFERPGQHHLSIAAAFALPNVNQPSEEFTEVVYLNCAPPRPDRGRTPCRNGANQLCCLDGLYRKQRHENEAEVRQLNGLLGPAYKLVHNTG